MPRLLLHSRDLRLRGVLAPTLGPEFHLVVESDSERTREIVAADGCDVLILDLDEYPGGDIRQDFESLRGASVPIVAMSGEGSRALALELVERGAYDWFRSPPVISELKAVVRRAQESSLLRHQAKGLGADIPALDRMVGNSARATVVYNLIRRVSELDAFVLITGESGTGKELIARAIHNLSPRRNLPFVTVSCGAIPETLIEAELFGYEKGSFTGAFGKRTGQLEQAGEGTLFIDELGELSTHTQVKLLRVLQEKEFSRLGGHEMIPLKARILFATHRNLMQMVTEGSFRQDLYYRVNVLGIKAPPLRERSEDIPALARFFAHKYATAFGIAAKNISPSAMALLVEHDWPGNIRELENAIQRAIIVSDGPEIRPEDLPDILQRPDLLGIGDEAPDASFEEQLQAFKLRLAQNAIHACHGNKTLAAHSLHISRTYLHRLIRGPEEPESDGFPGAEQDEQSDAEPRSALSSRASAS